MAYSNYITIWRPNYRVLIRNMWPHRHHPTFGLQVRMKLRRLISLAKRYQRHDYPYMP